MTKVDSRAALVEVLSSGFPEKFFVTEFVDSRGGNEFFRKIRAAIVKDEIIIVRVDCDTYWKIYARKYDERVHFIWIMRICSTKKSEYARTRKRGLDGLPSSRSGRFATGFPWMCSVSTLTLMQMGGWFFTRPMPP